MGQTVDLANTSTAGTTAAAIKSYIQGRYNNQSTRPSAVLLVGDTALIPSFVGGTTDSPDTDLYYACMDAGDDWQPELAIGRFSAANAAQLSAMVAKTVAYETAPAGAWMDKAVFMASEDNYSISEGTHNYVISQYLNGLGYASDKLYSHTYSATPAQVSAAFNDGRALGIYSGHGAETYWADGPEFYQSDVNALTNTGMYPFVASFACLTGNYAIGECFAETWQRAAGKGAVDVLASSVTSYWAEDDILEKKLFEAMFDDGALAFGQAVLRAKQLYLEYFGAGGNTRRYFEMYNLLGDPTVELAGQGLHITSPTALPEAYVDEPYSVTLGASGGQAPYTWQMTGGALPAGLTFEPATATISGLPASAGDSGFSMRVTDASGASDSRQFTLGVDVRLAILTPTPLPPASVNIPYSVSLQAGGGTGPYTWSMPGANQYDETQTPSAWAGGGTAKNWRADDQAWNLPLPWAFPFYGTDYTSVYVSSNGLLDFASPNSEYSNSTEGLLAGPRIAALWDDLRTDGTGDDIFVSSLGDRVIIRWAAHTYFDEGPVNVEAVLYRDGRIGLNYGAAHSGLTATIGISKGDGLAYTISSLDSNPSIPANTSLLFSPSGQLPAGQALSAAGNITGTPTSQGTSVFTVQVADSGLPQQLLTRQYSLTVGSLPPLTVTVPASAAEGAGPLQGQVSVPEPVGTDLVVSLQSGDTGQLTVSPTATIRAGQSSAYFALAIVDDSLLDGLQTVAVLAAASGYLPGSGAVSIHDNESADLTVALPAAAAEGAGTLANQGRVTASRAVDRDVTVQLASSDATELAVPATVLIRAGANSATFDLLVQDDSQIDGAQAVTVTAQADTWPVGSGGMSVLDDDRTLAVNLPGQSHEGAGVLAGAGSVTIGGTLGGNLTVTLACASTEILLPAQVTIPAGQTSASFDVTVLDDALYDGVQTAQVTAGATGFADAVDSMAVADNDVHHFGFAPIVGPRTQGVPFAVTITAQDVNNATVTTFGGAIDLTAAGDHGGVGLTVNGSAKPATGRKPVKPPVAAKSKPLGAYHTYASLTSDLAAYAAAYPSIARLYTLGQSVQGRELWAVQISDNPDLDQDEPEFKYVGTMHGDEPVGQEMCLYFIDYLLSGYGADPRVTGLVDGTEIWIVPLMNPDGLEADTRGNANGVDLNRDFPEGGAPYSIGNILDGPAMVTAGRQPEVVAVMTWSAAHSFVQSANFHAGALVVNYPYDNDGLGSVDSPTPDDALLEYVAELYSWHNQPMWNSPEFYHGISNGADWYSIIGGMQDWNYRYLGDNDLTIELSDVKRPIPSQLPVLWNQNRESMLALTEAAHMGVGGSVTDALSGRAVFASVSVAGNLHPVFSDLDLGDYHRMLLPGTYDLTFTAPGYYPKTVHDVTVSASGTAVASAALIPRGVVAFADGVWTGDVTADAADTNVVLTADDGAGHIGQSNSFKINAPLALVTPAPLPTAAIGRAYDVQLQAVGGLAPYAWSLTGGGDYLESDPGTGWLGGGTARGWHGDDTCWQLALPWAFTFYGSSYTSVYVCSNGYLDFADDTADYSNTQEELADSLRIAPLWDDLVTSGSDDIYVATTADYVAVRWAAHTYTGGYATNFECLLYRDGFSEKVRFNYRGSVSHVTPTIGLSEGAGPRYSLSWLDGYATLPPDASTLFSPGSLLPAGLSLDGVTGRLSGTPTSAGVYDFTVQVSDANVPAQSVQRAYSLTVAAASPAPLVPDLADASDTGISVSDDLTWRNNDGGGRTLAFQVGGLTAGAAVTIYADGVPIGSGLAGKNALITTDGKVVLADGPHVITATQTLAGLAESDPSDGLLIRIDTVAPTVTVTQRITADTTPALWGTVDDAEAGVELDVGGAVRWAVNSGGMWLLADNQIGPLALAWHDVTATATDRAGNVGTDSAVNDLRIALAGDCNLDNTVAFNDYQKLEVGFGLVGGGTWATGDFDGDGDVDFVDYQELEVNFGLSAKAAKSTAGLATASPWRAGRLLVRDGRIVIAPAMA